MKAIFGLVLIFVLAGCQAQNSPSSVTILEGDQIVSLQTSQTTPASIISEAGLTLGTDDKVAYRGVELPADFSLPVGGRYILQIQPAHALKLLSPDGQKSIQSTAKTVAQALVQAGFQPGVADFVSPPLETPIVSDLVITYRPARQITVSTEGQTLALKTSRLTVGQALVSAGFTLSALDRSEPADSEPIPADGKIKLVRVQESVKLTETTIPFSKKYTYSTSLAVGAQKVIQAGEVGLKMSRVRIRYEDGVIVKQFIESESVVKQPVDSLIGLGSQVQTNTMDTPAGPIQYWRAVQMYATSYSPCRSGVSECMYGTASGLPVKQGVVALVPSFYNQLAGTKVYIPGYGMAVVGDVGGGLPNGQLWIDLAYSDSDYQGWSGMVTVYFLAPAPANIPAGLN